MRKVRGGEAGARSLLQYHQRRKVVTVRRKADNIGPTLQSPPLDSCVVAASGEKKKKPVVVSLELKL